MKLSQILSKITKSGSLLGMEINGKVITNQTKNEDWSGYFNCYSDKLTSLEHAPRSVGGSFSCSSNYLTSLEHAPRTVSGDFSCSDNKLTSLEHISRSVGGDFYCSYNSLTSLHNIHKHLQQMNGKFYCNNNPITRQILGVLLIRGCTKLNFRDDVDKIINKYLPNTRGMVAVNECQDELIEAGLEDYAEL